MARVNDGSHSYYLPPTRLSISGMNHTCLSSLAADHHRTLAGTHFPSNGGLEAELAWVAWWNAEVICSPKTVTHPSTNRLRVTSLIRPTMLPLRHAATNKYSPTEKFMDYMLLCKFSFVTVRRVRRHAINATWSSNVSVPTLISRRPTLPLSTASSFQSALPATSLKVQYYSANRCPMLRDRCPVLSVCDVGVLWPNGWMDQDDT